MSSQEQRHVGYITNLCDFAIPLPHEVIPGFVLRKASASEREYISRFLATYAGQELNPHEYRWNFERGRGASRLSDPEEWRYHVIEYPADFPWFRLADKQKQKEKEATTVSDIFLEAVRVSDARLHCPIIGVPNPTKDSRCPTVCWTPEELATLHGRISATLDHEKGIRSVGKEALDDAAAAFHRLRNLKGDHLMIRDAIKRYQQSLALNAASQLRILAQFGTIEFLITHKPKPTETGDSLSRQLRSKLPLVARRFREEMSPEASFELPKKDSGWDALYELRSRIAHDGPKEVKACLSEKNLKSVSAAAAFLDEFARRLIRYALDEPQLILDLKKC